MRKLKNEIKLGKVARLFSKDKSKPTKVDELT